MASIDQIGVISILNKKISLLVAEIMRVVVPTTMSNVFIFVIPARPSLLVPDKRGASFIGATPRADYISTP
jgi:uncharacterized membrane protein (Fun14 family)